MTYERITKFDSPNFTPAASVVRVFGVRRRITGITIHHWGDPNRPPTFAAVVSWLCRRNGNTSAHAVIEAGRVAYIVNYKDAAWHTGNSQGNATTIGLELNPRASDADYATAAEHIADIWLSYGRIKLFPHKHWKATLCPGRWDLRRLENEAEGWYRKKQGKPAGGRTSASSATYYVVQPGDTLYGIARSNRLTVAELKKMNGLGKSDLIIIGRKIRIS